jgi:hypothetical protein
MTVFATLLTLAMTGQTAPQTPTPESPAAPSTELHGSIGTIGRIKGQGEDAVLLKDRIWLKQFLTAVKDANQGGEGAMNSLNLMIEDRKLVVVPAGSRIRIVNLRRLVSTNEIFAEVEVLSDQMKGTRGWITTGQLEPLSAISESLPPTLTIEAAKAAYRDIASQLAKVRSKYYPGNKQRASALAARDVAKLQKELMARYSLSRTEFNALMECGKAKQWDDGAARPARKDPSR